LNNKVFLALTPIEEFWDNSDPIVFIGKWCVLYGRDLNHNKIMASPYGRVCTSEEAYNYILSVYEHVLPVVSQAMNDLHEQDKSIRYWRILLGPWLQYYLSVVYDRYLHITSALASYPSFCTITLSEESFVVPNDTRDFSCKSSDDLYNLQIFSRILLFFGKKYTEKKYLNDDCLSYNFRNKRSWKQNLLGYILFFHKKVISRFIGTKLVFRNSGFPKIAEMKLLLDFKGGALSVRGADKIIKGHGIDFVLRNKLSHIPMGDDQFLKCVSFMLFMDMPRCFIEGYKSMSKLGDRQYPDNPGAILSANAWYNDEIFKCWAARSAERNTLLLGVSHGGNYCPVENVLEYNHEKKILDKYYVWGNCEQNLSNNMSVMPACSVVGMKKVNADNSKNGILWGLTILPRYLVRYPNIPMHFEVYLEWHKRFVSALSEDLLRNDFVIRPHREDLGWGVRQRLKDVEANLKFESWSVPFMESMLSNKLYVCDHLSTTYAQSLAIGMPTILFWNPECQKIKPQAIPYFELLKEYRILFDTPEEAAVEVERAYSDIESWWNDSGRQNAVNKFCENVINSPHNSFYLWKKELREKYGAVHLS